MILAFGDSLTPICHECSYWWIINEYLTGNCIVTT